MLTIAIWLIFIPAAYGLWLVLSEDGKDFQRVTQTDLAELHLRIRTEDQLRRHTWELAREADRHEWRRNFLEARELNRIRKFRLFWDGEVKQWPLT